ncbi:Uncharacterised protein [uncultured archaeon]|nr:Uncharacterised protein [uncultured archaeon]
MKEDLTGPIKRKLDGQDGAVDWMKFLTDYAKAGGRGNWSYMCCEKMGVWSYGLTTLQWNKSTGKDAMAWLLQKDLYSIDSLVHVVKKGIAQAELLLAKPL